MIKRCGDLNSAFCPCMLSEVNKCEYCSRLQGKDYCDCNWSGKCPLYEKYWLIKGGGQVRQNLRLDYPGRIISRQQVSKSMYIYEIETSLNLTAELIRAGAFVFLRCQHDPKEAHFPVGMMTVDGSRLTVAIECTGIKTRRFCEYAEDEIIVTGPYFNGVLGSPWIDKLEYGRVLLIAGGSGQAPAVSMSQKLAASHNKIICLLSAGHSDSLFAKSYLERYIKASDIHIIKSLPEDGVKQLHSLTANTSFDLVVSAGPDGQHNMLIQYFKDKNLNVPMAATNNAVMCCGEGLCGSCRRFLKSGEAVRMCKAQVSFDEVQDDF